MQYSENGDSRNSDTSEPDMRYGVPGPVQRSRMGVGARWRVDCGHGAEGGAAQ